MQTQENIMSEKILHLTLKKKWFDLIISGQKAEEYREFKSYWWQRLSEYSDGEFLFHKTFDAIKFTNGYKKESPSFFIECKNITVGYGDILMGAPDKPCYIIKLGKVLNQ